MINGAKRDIPQTETISNSRPAIAVLFVGLVAAFAIHLVKNFDSQKQSLNFFGKTL
jgi:hypothetical protein